MQDIGEFIIIDLATKWPFDNSQLLMINYEI
jgi:hypothetical protein